MLLIHHFEHSFLLLDIHSLNLREKNKNKLLIQHRKDLPGRIVNGEHFSGIIAIATVVQIRNCRSCTLRVFNNIARTSCGLIALAI